jgi:hypothetical protein
MASRPSQARAAGSQRMGAGSYGGEGRIIGPNLV